MAPRPLPTLLLAALLGLPALAAAGPADPSAPMPDCAVAIAADRARPALVLVGQAQDAAAPWVNLAAHYGSQLVQPALPESEDSIFLAGEGVMTVQLAGNGQVCEGTPRMVLEASRKSFGLEPTVTFSYGGGRGDGGLMTPCARGQARQPVKDDITGAFDGAWSATKTFSDYTWRIDVGAPQPDGTRTASYRFADAAGAVSTFEGVLAEYR